MTRMFSENDKHCQECACRWCDLRETEHCLDGANNCDKCDNTQHIGWCPWNDEEEWKLEV